MMNCNVRINIYYNIYVDFIWDDMLYVLLMDIKEHKINLVLEWPMFFFDYINFTGIDKIFVIVNNKFNKVFQKMWVFFISVNHTFWLKSLNDL